MERMALIIEILKYCLICGGIFIVGLALMIGVILIVEVLNNYLD